MAAIYHPAAGLEFDHSADTQGRINRMTDQVNHPKHYNDHPSGIECITITEHMGFNLGNAIMNVF